MRPLQQAMCALFLGLGRHSLLHDQVNLFSSSAPLLAQTWLIWECRRSNAPHFKTMVTVKAMRQEIPPWEGHPRRVQREGVAYIGREPLQMGQHHIKASSKQRLTQQARRLIRVLYEIVHTRRTLDKSSWITWLLIISKWI